LPLFAPRCKITKAISRFGGPASFISFLGQIGFAPEVQRRLPFAEPISNNFQLAHSLTAFLMAVVVGRNASITVSCCGPIASCTPCWTWSGFPSDDSPSATFLSSPCRGVLMAALALPVAAGAVAGPGLRPGLEFDGVLLRGATGGRTQGLYPRRKGRNSHHPLLAVLAEAQFILLGWLHSGNTGAARGVVPLL
jgi:hypothetical protein